MEITGQQRYGEAYQALEHVESLTGMVPVHAGVASLASQVTGFQPNDVLFGKLRPYLAKLMFHPR